MTSTEIAILSAYNAVKNGAKRYDQSVPNGALVTAYRVHNLIRIDIKEKDVRKGPSRPPQP